MTATVIKPKPFRLQRSDLAVPATSERFFLKAAQGGADAVFLDLEDAVAPALKPTAREAAIRALNEIDWGDKLMSVRVNSLDTEWAHRDILEVASRCPRLDLILLPKTGTPFDVQFVDQLLTGIEREHKRDKRIGIQVLIETTLGLAHAEQIAASSERLEAMVFGVGDYSIDLRSFDRVFGAANPDYAMLTDPDETGARLRHWNDQWHFALARIANACRAYGLRPIDGPFTNYGDPDGYLASARRGTALGFEGKWAIHPTQVELANQVFTPSPEQVAWAGDLARTIAEADAEGRGAIGQKGVLLDRAHEKLANTILRRAAAADAHAAAHSATAVAS